MLDKRKQKTKKKVSRSTKSLEYRNVCVPRNHLIGTIGAPQNAGINSEDEAIAAMRQASPGLEDRHKSNDYIQHTVERATERITTSYRVRR